MGVGSGPGAGGGSANGHSSVISYLGSAFAWLLGPTQPIERAADGGLGALLDAAPDAMVIVDEAGRIVQLNAQTDILFGYGREELIGQPVERLVPERFPERHVAHRAAYQREPRLRPMGVGLELYGQRKDASEFPIEISLSPLETEGGRFVTAAVRDITERKRGEAALRQRTEQLARSNEELERFAYVASHDLQEPLRMIASYVQLLDKRYSDQLDTDAREFIGYAVDGVRRMQALIEDLLAFSRAGRRPVPLKPTAVTHAIDQALANLEVAAAEAHAVVSRDPLPIVLGDETELVQLFQNLLANAIKFRGPEPPRIHVGARKEGDHWILSVGDNGIGIDPQFHDRIFTIFQRLHTRDVYPGTGIGLAICKRIVERRGGHIWVESQPGAGTTFLFTIPAIAT